MFIELSESFAFLSYLMSLLLKEFLNLVEKWLKMKVLSMTTSSCIILVVNVNCYFFLHFASKLNESLFDLMAPEMNQFISSYGIHHALILTNP